VSATTISVVGGLLSFDCPRCRGPVSERFYGPCQPCRAELHKSLYREPSTVKTVLLPPEPKLNVVPNFVATKDDLAGPDEDFLV
jgi:hypothetical protein